MLSEDSEFVHSIKLLFPEISDILIGTIEGGWGQSNEPIFRLGSAPNEISSRDYKIRELKEQMLSESLASADTFQKIIAYRSQIGLLRKQVDTLENFSVIDFSNELLRKKLLQMSHTAEEFSASTERMIDEYIWAHRTHGIKYFPVYIKNLGSGEYAIFNAYYKMQKETSKEIDRCLKEKDRAIPLTYQMTIAGLIPEFFHTLNYSVSSYRPWDKVIDLCSNYGFNYIRNQKTGSSIPDNSAFRLILIGFNDRLVADLQTFKKPDSGISLKRILNLLELPKTTSHSFEVYK